MMNEVIIFGSAHISQCENALASAGNDLVPLSIKQE